MIITTFLFFFEIRDPVERIDFCMEPFIRLHLPLSAYAAFLDWDEQFFRTAASLETPELAKLGLHLRPLNFPTLVELLELKV